MMHHNFMYNLDHSLDEVLKAFGLEHTNIYIKSVVSLGAIALGSFGDGMITLSHNELFNAFATLLKAGSQIVGILLGSVTLLKIGIDITKYCIKKIKDKKSKKNGIKTN